MRWCQRGRGANPPPSKFLCWWGRGVSKLQRSVSSAMIGGGGTGSEIRGWVSPEEVPPPLKASSRRNCSRPTANFVSMAIAWLDKAVAIVDSNEVERASMENSRAVRRASMAYLREMLVERGIQEGDQDQNGWYQCYGDKIIISLGKILVFP